MVFGKANALVFLEHISASRKLDKNLKDVTIFNFDKEFNIKEKFFHHQQIFLKTSGF